MAQSSMRMEMAQSVPAVTALFHIPTRRSTPAPNGPESP